MSESTLAQPTTELTTPEQTHEARLREVIADQIPAESLAYLEWSRAEPAECNRILTLAVVEWLNAVCQRGQRTPWSDEVTGGNACSGVPLVLFQRFLEVEQRLSEANAILGFELEMRIYTVEDAPKSRSIYLHLPGRFRGVELVLWGEE